MFKLPALALSSLILATTMSAAATPGAQIPAQGDYRFPASRVVVDVTQAPYNARGDGRTDDTAAFQAALDDMMGRHRILFVPNGTYLISKTLTWKNRNKQGQGAWGFNWIQGQNTGKTILRLKDKTFTNPAQPQAIMWCGGFGSADWFHNYIQGITFNSGRDNPGAVGLQFYSNNTGALREVEILSEDGSGVIGLDLAHRDMNGPLLVRNVHVRGFDLGIRTGASVNSQTFENISLSGQKKYGFVNSGQCISIRGMHSENAVPALRAESTTCLLDSVLIGTAAARETAAVEITMDSFLARGVQAKGYKLGIAGKDKTARHADLAITEFHGRVGTSPFGGVLKALGLEVAETPEAPWDDPKDWAVVDQFGADPEGKKDSAEAIQKAIDSGASTVFFPGFYHISKPVIVRGKVRRLQGCGAWLDYLGKSKPDLIIDEGESPSVWLEHFANINGGIQIKTKRTVVLRSLEVRHIQHEGSGPLYLEDTGTHDLKIKRGQKVWARQLNIENEGTHLTNDGGDLWVLGYKTERGGTLLDTRGGGRSEIFGNFSYTTTQGKLAPMFTTTDASVFAFFAEVCYSGDPFAVWIRESRGGVVKEVKHGQGTITPYVGRSDK